MHAVLAENWVVYTYWSAAEHRFQASVLELYDDSPRSLGPVQLVFGSNNATLSSYQPVHLEVCCLPLPLDMTRFERSEHDSLTECIS